MTIHAPADPTQLREVIAWAGAREEPLEIIGHGTKRSLGRPLQLEHQVDLSLLSGIVDYEPSELILTARAATPLSEIEAALGANGQMLAFEPPDLGELIGGIPGRQSLGGVLGCNLSGSRRVKSGASRDHFLGFEAVSGRGEAFKAGGKVVKNVTGYDLCKLMAGSYGTLAVLTEVTVKVVPRPEKSRTLLIYGLDDQAGVRALSRALNSPHEVSAAAHLPRPAAAKSQVDRVRRGHSVTALRIEGPTISVTHRCGKLREMLGPLGLIEELHSRNSALFWSEVGGVGPLAGLEHRVVWRLSVPPSAGPEVTAALAGTCDAQWFYDWGGGLVWLSLGAGEDSGAKAVRGAVARVGGHATLVRAPAGVRAAIEVFQPSEPALTRVTARVKLGFDPLRILNRGRMSATL